MSLGTNIHRLRTRHNMSQGDLADALGVSRQSISKWETDGAVPELDKLIRLSSIFSVTLDELVHGETPDSLSPEPPTVPPYRSSNRTAALVWLILALLGLFCSFMVGIPALGILLMFPFLSCSLVCLLCKQHPVLYSFWILLILVDLYLRFTTGLSWAATRLTFIWTPQMNYMRLAIAWVQLLCILAITLATVLIYRKQPLVLVGQAKTRYMIGWAALAGTALILRLPLHQLFTFGFDNFYSLIYGILDYIRIILFNIQLTATVRWLHTRKQQ